MRNAMAMGAVRRWYNTATPIAKTIAHHTRKRSMVPRNLAMKLLGSSVGKKSAQGRRAAHRFSHVIQRYDEQLLCHEDDFSVGHDGGHLPEGRPASDEA